MGKFFNQAPPATEDTCGGAVKGPREGERGAESDSQVGQWDVQACTLSVSVSDMFGKSGQRILTKSCLLRPKVKGPSGFQVLLMPCSLLEMFEAVAGV